MLILIALAQAIAVPPAAPAQPPATIVAEPAALAIAAFDANGDAKVTRAELDAGLTRSFATADGAAIGYIAYADWALMWLGDRNALPSPFEVDRDGDDKITLAELRTCFGRYLARYDLDKDGVLTRAELVSIRASAGGPEGRGKKR